MIVVHHLNDSRSQRILWLLEELGLDYDIVRHQRDPKTLLAPPAPSNTSVLPSGCSPATKRPGSSSMPVASDFADACAPAAQTKTAATSEMDR